MHHRQARVRRGRVLHIPECKLQRQVNGEHRLQDAREFGPDADRVRGIRAGPPAEGVSEQVWQGHAGAARGALQAAVGGHYERDGGAVCYG